MKVDRGAQLLQFAARGRRRHPERRITGHVRSARLAELLGTPRHIGPALLAVDFVERIGSKKLREFQNPRLGLIGPLNRRPGLVLRTGQIKIEYIGDQDLRRMIRPLAHSLKHTM